MSYTELMRVLGLVLLLAACSKPSGPPLDARGLPTVGGAWYRCDHDDAWQRVDYGVDLHCEEGGAIICPAGDCRIAYHRSRGGRMWALDIQWSDDADRRRPQELVWQYVYRVYQATPATVATAAR
jgi:hypothetical protein